MVTFKHEINPDLDEDECIPEMAYCDGCGKRAMCTPIEEIKFEGSFEVLVEEGGNLCPECIPKLGDPIKAVEQSLAKLAKALGH